MRNYQDFLASQRLRTLSVSADGTMLAYVSDTSGQFNLWTRPADGGPAKQLTFFTDRSVREVAWAPDTQMIAFTADTQGNEQCQVYLVPRSGGEPVLMSTGNGQHNLAEKAPFTPDGRYLLYSGPSDGDPAIPDVIACDLATRTEHRWHGPANLYGFAVAISPDGKHVLGGALDSNTTCQSYLASADAPGTDLDQVTASLPGEYYYPGPWSGDSESFYLLTTDADHDHVSLAQFSIASNDMTLVDSAPWDVENVITSADGHTVLWSVNEDGYSVLRARRDGADLTMPPIPGGVITTMSVSADGAVLAVQLDTADRPASAVVLRPGTSEPVTYLTDTRPQASADSTEPELIRFPTEDGTLIPAWLYRPEGPGPHPVLLSIHGGPEQQARPEHEPLHQCLVASGIAVLAPNIHGSAGYGHAWQGRIYRDWGGIDLDDLAAAHTWLTAQPWADPSKLAVYGLSYGGFAALSCLTRLPDLWAAGVSVCGPTNLESLARSMPPDWAAVVAAMFGDPDGPGVAEDLRRRSPLTYASQIAAPLLVIQGANDPRVPKAESDQIIDAARVNGADARYLVFDDEGHGFTSRDNDIKANQAIVEFLSDQLLPARTMSTAVVPA